jgi:hypothetical protein
MMKVNGNNRLAHLGEHTGAPISGINATACTGSVRHNVKDLLGWSRRPARCARSAAGELYLVQYGWHLAAVVELRAGSNAGACDLFCVVGALI